MRIDSNYAGAIDTTFNYNIIIPSGWVYTQYFKTKIPTGKKLYIQSGGKVYFSKLPGQTPKREIFIINETQVANTMGGTFTSGADRTRTLNTIKTNLISGALLLTANQFSLPIGNYNILAFAPSIETILHQAKLYNVGTATDILIGSSETTNVNRNTSRSVIAGTFSVISTASSNNIFEIRHRCSNTKVTYGLGEACNLGNNEVYTIVIIERIIP